MLFPNVVIGADPQDISYRGSDTRVEIGDGNTFREGVTVNRASEKEDGVTRIGSHNFLMANCHVAHDCKLGDHILIANGSLLAGHVHVHDHAAISGGCGVHQFVTIGSYSFISALSRALHDVPPFMLVEGIPARPRCINIVALEAKQLHAGAGRAAGRGPSAAVPLEGGPGPRPRDSCGQRSAFRRRAAPAGVHRGAAGRQARPRPRSEESRVSRAASCRRRRRASGPHPRAAGRGRAARSSWSRWSMRGARRARPWPRRPAAGPSRDFRELVGEIDAAVVATPTFTHHAIASELIRGGVHVLVEKPIAPNVREADELVQLARRRHVVLQVGHVERFNPGLVSVERRLAEPKFIEARRQSGYTFRSTDVGVVLDLMIHDIDVALSLVKSPVVQVDALGVSVMGDHEDMVSARLRFANGAVANLTASRMSYAPARTMQVFTATGFASIDFATRRADGRRAAGRRAAAHAARRRA